MRNFWIFGVLAFLGALSLALSCGGDDDSTTARVGEDDDDATPTADDDDEGTAFEVPDGVFDFLDEEEMQDLADTGVTIYDGDVPPNVEGIYLLDSLEITYDEQGLTGFPIVPITLKFHDQSGDNTLKTDYESSLDSGLGIGSFIAGKGDCFSVFVRLEVNAGGCRYKSPTIYSACTGESGLVNLQWSFLIKDKNPPDTEPGSPCTEIIPDGAKRIVEEKDGLAAYVADVDDDDDDTSDDDTADDDTADDDTGDDDTADDDTGDDDTAAAARSGEPIALGSRG
ncbi:MAG: hypothetical protein H6685_06150 [Deltaproteobacteria bacterium]|nr:hypothetical protein [Deltaproteobacteria bacterium]